VDPVIIDCSLQRLPRIYWTAHFLLFLSVIFSDFEGALALNTILFPLFLCLLLVRNLGRFDKVLFGIFNWAEGTFVVLL
jgi:hypothetical protein